MLKAITRQVGRSIINCELTHLERIPIDLPNARLQHAAYEAALRSLGRGQVTAEHVAHLRELLSPEDRGKLVEDLAQAPAWMRPHLRMIGGPEALA